MNRISGFEERHDCPLIILFSIYFNTESVVTILSFIKLSSEMCNIFSPFFTCWDATYFGVSVSSYV